MPTPSSSPYHTHFLVNVPTTTSPPLSNTDTVAVEPTAEVTPAPATVPGVETTDGINGSAAKPLSVGKLPQLADTQSDFRLLLVEDSPTQAAIICTDLLKALPDAQLSISRVPTLREARAFLFPALPPHLVPVLSDTASPPAQPQPSSSPSFVPGFDLVILDVSLPDGSGFELCQELKKQPITASIPVALFSEASLAHLSWAASQAGADYCISKDVTGGDQTLIVLVQSLLHQQRPQLEQPAPPADDTLSAPRNRNKREAEG